MDSKVTEIGALQDIDNLLSQLTDEERVRIMHFIKSKYKLIGTDNSKDTSEDQNGEGVIQDNTKLTIKEFINLKKPDGFYERIACLAYYLEKIQGLEGFKTSDITQANKDARQNPMSNPTYFVNDTTIKYGYLMPVGSGNKALSARGEALVEALPNREKVKEILEEFRLKRKVTKKIKKNLSI